MHREPGAPPGGDLPQALGLSLFPSTAGMVLGPWQGPHGVAAPGAAENPRAGARPQPRVHFQRRALRLPENTSYGDLTAFLTAASSPSEVDGFPYLRGLDGNGTGNNLICLLQGESVFA